MTQFYDAATVRDIPHDATHAALYADGHYAVQAGDPVRHIPHLRWITVTGDLHHCGIADFEPRNPVYEQHNKLREWAIGRLSLHMSLPVVYCDRTNLHLAASELAMIPHRWWIPTLDDKQWTPDELSVDILERYEVVIPASHIWANQFTDHQGDYDISNLFGRWYA